jgi:hypothetical protein
MKLSLGLGGDERFFALMGGCRKTKISSGGRAGVGVDN